MIWEGEIRANNVENVMRLRGEEGRGGERGNRYRMQNEGRKGK